ncbi:regulator of nonsense transcripts 1-like [Daktulosphaira vitifoliae]|uniref:regulator of nonsense transcripts 1-like n=1 Tax=Daktulosphaira vitifoliae TaxID=58002 RepID=UPI0021AAC18E|nr:regulator of nonsense transcripts 1-like [Daktulosphaira vitifoliae]
MNKKQVKEQSSKQCLLHDSTRNLNKKSVLCLQLLMKKRLPYMQIGSEIKFQYLNDNPCDLVGKIINIPQKNIIEVELDQPFEVEKGSKLIILRPWNNRIYVQMFTALTRFAEKMDCMSHDLRSIILGHYIRSSLYNHEILEDFQAPGLPIPNYLQKIAIKNANRETLSLIQGPSLTGKTTLCAIIAYHLSKFGSVLLCAPTKKAVDYLTDIVAKSGVRVVRMGTLKMAGCKSSDLLLSNKIKELNGHNEFKKLQMMKEKLNKLNEQDEITYKRLKKLAEVECLKFSQVVCTTCDFAGDSRLAEFKFRAVIIDRSTQTNEPNCLIPMINGAEQVVLTGDNIKKRSLSTGRQNEFNRSLFERLLELGAPLMRLKIRYFKNS